MAFCTNCGAQAPDGTKFCPSCGQKIEVKAPAVSVQEAPAQQSYTAPVQATPVQVEQPAQSEAPVQGAYQAPTQQSYQAPTQQSYQAPTQQSYQPQGAAQPAYAAAPKVKKPVNKKLLFIIGGAVLAVILAIVLISVLGGGSKTTVSDDPNVGVYNATTAEMMGMEIELSDLWEKGFSIELKDKGKCSMNIDGSKGNGKWTLDGSTFHVEGGGIDCDGTLSGGKMVLENVLGMGVTLTFEMEGGATAPVAGGSDTQGANNTAVADIQKQWNGTWYGCMYVCEATGSFAGIPSDFYDVYMVVDVDGDGKGQFAVFLDGVSDAFAKGNCEVTAEGLYATDGVIAGEMEMYANNWIFLPRRDYTDEYCMTDVIEDGDDLFDYALNFKPWGASWQEEIDDEFNLTPPSIEIYNAAIANGELPPVGFAPIGYKGAVAASAGTGDNNSNGENTGDTGDTLDTSAYDTSSFNGVVDLEGKGLVELNYPDDLFTQDSSRHTIKSMEKRIFFTTVYVYPVGSDSIQGSDDFMSSLSTCEDFVDSQVTIAGFPTRRVTCIDNNFDEPFVYYLIDTTSANNADVGGVYIKVNILNVEDYALVDAIVSTMKVK